MRWSSGKDEVLKVCEARSIPGFVESILISDIVVNSTRDEKELSRIKMGVTASVGEVV